MHQCIKQQNNELLVCRKPGNWTKMVFEDWKRLHVYGVEIKLNLEIRKVHWVF
jgi:hypothetical protein